MRLRTFLVRRSIQTVITLLIVLVLLFLIFRLMPGDPTRFFIRPGQTAEDVASLRVSLGFAHWEPAPGNGYSGVFSTPELGVYEITVHAVDAAGRTQPFYFTQSKPGDTVAGVPHVVPAAAAANGGPDWGIGPGDAVEISAELKGIPTARQGENWTANVTVSSGGAVVAPQFPATPDNLKGTVVHATWNVTVAAAYNATVTFTSEDKGDRFSESVGFAANTPSPAPFALVEDRLSAGWVGVGTDSARVTVNVTSAGSTISSVTADVRQPGGGLVQVTMLHPNVAVPNNVLEEFWSYMTHMLVGDFGRSLYSRELVWDIIAQKVGPSLLLFGSAVIISYLLGILIGAVLAWRRGSKMELSAIVISLFFYSMPVFWFGLILLWAFAFLLDWFPLGGFADIEAVKQGGLSYVLNVLWHMSLPLLNLVILGLAGHVLLMRNSMLEVMGEDYITTAKAKGISERRVMYRHAARNAMLPVVTAFALSISGTISGGVLTETIFSWPGMGAFLVTSTIQQDFPSVQGAFFLLAILTIMANLIADILYAWLDPRVRL